MWTFFSDLLCKQASRSRPRDGPEPTPAAADDGSKVEFESKALWPKEVGAEVVAVEGLTGEEFTEQRGREVVGGFGV